MQEFFYCLGSAAEMNRSEFLLFQSHQLPDQQHSLWLKPDHRQEFLETAELISGSFIFPQNYYRILSTLPGRNRQRMPSPRSTKLHAQTSTSWTLCISLTVNPTNRAAPAACVLGDLHRKAPSAPVGTSWYGWDFVNRLLDTAPLRHRPSGSTPPRAHGMCARRPACTPWRP